MLNPISEMKAQITTAKVLTRDLSATFKAKQKAITHFYQAQEQAQESAASGEKIAEKPTACEAPPAPQATATPKADAAPTKRSFIADKHKEQQLLTLAKAEYQNYQDVSRFAEQLGLNGGVVYLTLKFHGFIQQNETTQYRVLDSYYRNNGNLKRIADEVNLGVWICAKTLENLGISPNWASYKERENSSRVGDFAEEEFKRLVPQALDMNMQYQMNNPGFDFIVNGKTIDVKAATLWGAKAQYLFRVRRTADAELPDFFCFFIMGDKEKGSVAGNYDILLVPKEVIPDKNNQVTIIPKDRIDRGAISAFYWDFQVEPAALAAMLDAI